MNQHELDIVMGRDPISRAMNCHHDYVLSIGGGVRCLKCEIEITEDARVRYAIKARKPDAAELEDHFRRQFGAQSVV